MNLFEFFLFCFIQTKQNVQIKPGLDKALFFVDFQQFFYKVDLLQVDENLLFHTLLYNIHSKIGRKY